MENGDDVEDPAKHVEQALIQSSRARGILSAHSVCPISVAL